MARTGTVEDLFRVRVVLDSIPRRAGGVWPQASHDRRRLLSFQLTYPRILLAELNT